MKSVLAFGTVASPEAMMVHRGANVPMAKWLGPLLEAVQQQATGVRLLSHAYDAAFPRGRLFPGSPWEFSGSLQTHVVRYPNLPIGRTACMSYLYRRMVTHIPDEYDTLITYNVYPWYDAAIRYLSGERRKKWVPIILDPMPEMGPTVADQIAGYTRLCENADGVVVLSHYTYEHLQHNRKLHLDAGCGEVFFDLKPAPRLQNGPLTVLYSGKIQNTYGGSQILAEAIRHTRAPNVRFVICGKGTCSELDAVIANDKRVEVLGFVDEDTLHRLCLEADVFLNPRNPAHPDNDFIFPSKILHYLAYGKPVVSTWTGGLAPEYRTVLDVAEDATGKSLALRIEAILHEDAAAADNRRIQQYEFLRTHRWQDQARRLLTFIDAL